MTHTVAELVDLLRAAAAPTPPPEYCLFWFNHWSTCMQKSEWASWVQALGAIVALTVAVGVPMWLKWREVKEKRVLAIANAKLHAANLSVMLTHVSGCLQAVDAFFALAVKEKRAPSSVQLGIQGVLLSAVELPTDDQIIALAPIDHELPFRLMGGVRFAKQAKSTIELLHQIPEGALLDRLTFPHNLVVQSNRLIEEANDQIEEFLRVNGGQLALDLLSAQVPSKNAAAGISKG